MKRERLGNKSKPALFLSPAHGVRPETLARNSELLTILQEKLDIEVLSSEPKRSRWAQIRNLIFKPEPALAEELKARAEPGKLLWISDGVSHESLDLIPLARSLGYSVIVDKSEFGFLRNPIRAAHRDRSEGRDCRGSHVVIAASRLSASRLQKIAPGSLVHVIPNPIDCDSFTEARVKEGASLLMGGRLDSESTAEGLIWFIHEVAPRLKNALGRLMPEIVIATSTSHANEQWLQAVTTDPLAKDLGIRFVPTSDASLRSLLPEAKIVFIPSRESRHSRIAILEAMAAGRPVVTTGQAAQGLSFSPSYDLWIADQADNFASGMLKLLSDEPFRQAMAKHAVESVAKNHDRDRVAVLVDELIGRLDSPHGFGPPEPTEE